MERIVLAYSGGLDTSVAIPWLKERYHAEIIAVTMDLGQGKELEAVRDRALAAGAVRAHVLDLREEFARRLHPACVEGRCALRRSVSAGDGARPAADRAEARRDRRHRARGLRRARLYWQRQRSGAARRHHAGPQARSQGDRACARVGNDAARGDRICADARRGRAGHGRQSVQRGRELWGRSIECGVLEDPWPSPRQRSTR